MTESKKSKCFIASGILLMLGAVFTVPWSVLSSASVFFIRSPILFLLLQQLCVFIIGLLILLWRRIPGVHTLFFILCIIGVFFTASTTLFAISRNFFTFLSLLHAPPQLSGFTGGSLFGYLDLLSGGYSPLSSCIFSLVRFLGYTGMLFCAAAVSRQKPWQRWGLAFTCIMPVYDVLSVMVKALLNFNDLYKMLAYIPINMVIFFSVPAGMALWFLASTPSKPVLVSSHTNPANPE